MPKWLKFESSQERLRESSSLLKRTCHVTHRKDKYFAFHSGPVSGSLGLSAKLFHILLASDRHSQPAIPKIHGLAKYPLALHGFEVLVLFMLMYFLRKLSFACGGQPVGASSGHDSNVLSAILWAPKIKRNGSDTKIKRHGSYRISFRKGSRQKKAFPIRVSSPVFLVPSPTRAPRDAYHHLWRCPLQQNTNRSTSEASIIHVEKGRFASVP